MPRLIKANGSYEWIGAFTEKFLAKNAGFVWSRNLKRWVTENPDTANILIRYADEETRAAIESDMAAKRQRVAQSRISDTDFEPSAPKGMKYYPYQKAGIKFLLDKLGG